MSLHKLADLIVLLLCFSSIVLLSLGIIIGGVINRKGPFEGVSLYFTVPMAIFLTLALFISLGLAFIIFTLA